MNVSVTVHSRVASKGEKILFTIDTAPASQARSTQREHPQEGGGENVASWDGANTYLRHKAKVNMPAKKPHQVSLRRRELGLEH